MIRRLLVEGERKNAFFYYSYQNLSYSYSPTQRSEKIFSMDSGFFKICDKETRWTTYPPRGRGGGVLPDGIYNVTFYRGWFSSMQLRLGLGIEIREQLFYREGFGEFSLIECSKIQLNQEYRLGFRGSQQRLPPKKFSQDPPPPLPPTPLGGKS